MGSEKQKKEIIYCGCRRRGLKVSGSSPPGKVHFLAPNLGGGPHSQVALPKVSCPLLTHHCLCSSSFSCKAAKQDCQDCVRSLLGVGGRGTRKQRTPGYHQTLASSSSSSSLEITGNQFNSGTAKGSNTAYLAYPCSFQANYTTSPYVASEGSQLIGNKTLAG